MSKSFMKSLTRVISVLDTMAVGAMIVIGAQAMGLLPFHREQTDLFKWLDDDPTVALWLQPGAYYLAIIIGLVLVAILHHSISRAITVPIDEHDGAGILSMHSMIGQG